MSTPPWHPLTLGNAQDVGVWQPAELTRAFHDVVTAPELHFEGWHDGVAVAVFYAALISMAARLFVSGPPWLGTCQHCHRVIARVGWSPIEGESTWRHAAPDAPIRCNVPGVAPNARAVPIPHQEYTPVT